jgi:hypothetical protein
MLNTLKELSNIEFEITNDDLDLFTRCFKSYIGLKRNQHRKLVALIHKDKININTKNIHLLEMLKNKLSSEIIELSNIVIDISQNFLKYLLISNVKYIHIEIKKGKTLFSKNIS